MLCPEVWNFPPPKVMSATKRNINLDNVKKAIQMNNFYRSLVLTCPDELQTPMNILESLTGDNDYYELTDCPLTVFMETTFVDKFVKNGKLFCLASDRDCVVQNSIAITPDGIMTLHILEYIFQCLGLEGKKQLHNFYEVKIDLKKTTLKIKQCISKLECFNLNVSWHPDNEDVCPSSIAKYFYERGINVSVRTPKIKVLTPEVKEIPSVKDVDLDELSEWIGMLVLEGNLTPSHEYVSSYSQPESETPLRSTRISVLIVNCFFTSNIICNICDKLSEHVSCRETDNYWASISIQSYEDCPWRWNYSSPSVFQAHDSSTSLFFTKGSHAIYSIGQIKIS